MDTRKSSEGSRINRPGDLLDERGGKAWATEGLHLKKVHERRLSLGVESGDRKSSVWYRLSWSSCGTAKVRRSIHGWLDIRAQS